MTALLIYLLISGIGFPITLGLLIKNKSKERSNNNAGNT